MKFKQSLIVISVKQAYKIAVLILILFIFNCSPQDEQYTNRVSTIINKDWHFQIGDTINNVNWSQVNVPNAPIIEPLIVNDQWQGICWYRKALPSDFLSKNKNHFVKFEGVMQEATVWVNNIKVVHHKGGYLPFTINITKHIDYSKLDNTIIVKVVNTDNPTIPPGKALKDLDFNLYGGIYRNVRLISTNKVYITDAIAANKVNSGGILIHFDEISEQKAEGFVKIHIQNDTDEEKQLKTVKSITFSPSWGDPMMNPDAYEIIDYLLECLPKGAHLKNVTNGSMRNEEFWWKLGSLALVHRHKKFTTVFDIDGIDQEMHSQYRRNTKLQNVLDNMKAFSDNDVSNTFSKTIVFNISNLKLGCD